MAVQGVASSVPAGPESGLARALDLMAADETRFVAEMATAVTDELPALRELPTDLIETSLTMNFRRALAAVRSSRAESADIAAEARRDAATIARAGIPLETALDAYRLATSRGWELSREYAQRCELDSDTVLDAGQVLWEWSERFMVLIAEGYRDAEARLARGDRDARDAFVRRLLRGTASDADLRGRASAYGLAPSAPYRAFRARAHRPEELPRLRMAIETGAGAGGRQPLVALVDGDLAGVLPGCPAIETSAVVAVGHATDLRSVAGSFVLASRVLETALALGRTGVIRMEDLSLRLAVGSEEVLGDSLVLRYLAPLDDHGGFGEVLESSLREYLRTGMRIDEAAGRLHVHPNSLRHRLRRFEELTGADLRRLEHVIELWWALERRALLRGGGGGRAVAGAG